MTFEDSVAKTITGGQEFWTFSQCNPRQMPRLGSVNVSLLLQVGNQRSSSLGGGVDAELVLQHQLLFELLVVCTNRLRCGALLAQELGIVGRPTLRRRPACRRGARRHGFAVAVACI